MDTGQNLFTIVTITNYFKLIILKCKISFNNKISKIMYNFCMCKGNTLLVGGGSNLPPPAGKTFTVFIFRKNTSNHAKLMVELYICDNLNKLYRFFHVQQKSFERFINILGNRQADNRLISFVHL